MPPEGWELYPAGEIPVTTGSPTLLVRRRVLSPQLRNYRDILVAMPAHAAEVGFRCPAVYLQDGQNLFDADTSYAEPWGLLEILGRLARAGVAPIVVGVPNQGRLRRYEYSPFRDIIHGGGGGDRYLAFLAETVKPLVDRDFPTLQDPAATTLGGASLGGLISLYGAVRHPEVFGNALVQSPALWFAGGAIFPWFTGRRRPLRLHLDIGTGEGEEAVADVRRLRDLLLDAGAVEGVDLSYTEDPDAAHNEVAWGRRLERALPFLLGGRNPA